MSLSLPVSITAFLLFSTSVANALTPAHLWSQRFGSALDDQSSGLALDNVGDLVVAGSFTGTVDFGGGGLASAGSVDIFIAKYDPAGAHQWSRRFGGASAENPYEVTVDASRNVVIVGNFNGTVDFGGGNLASAGGSDIFVAKYNSAGGHLWSQRFGAGSNDSGASVRVDASGNVFVTGYFAGTVTFGGGNLVAVGNDIFVAKFSSTGVHQWSQSYGGAGNDGGAGVAVDALGDAVITGTFENTVDFGGGNLVSAAASDIYLAKLSSGGAHQWSQSFGGTSTDAVSGIAIDALGNAITTGHFAGTVNFGGGDLVSAGVFDSFLAKHNSAGVHQWSQRFGSTSNEFGYGVATDSAGDVAITGNFVGSVNFGGGNLVSAGSSDIYLAKYTSTGVHQWSRSFGGTLADNGLAAATDATGGAIVAGYFQDSANFGGGNLFSAGTTDVFVARYSGIAAAPEITSITDIGNDQGRKVRIRFDRSGVDDAAASVPVTHYVAFRRDAPAPATLLTPEASSQPLADGWTEVGSVGAFAEASYGIDVPTVGDSTIAQGQYYSAFYVRAATDVPSQFFDSEADSGYSVDNLAPGVPSNLVYGSGILSWDESSAEDFDYFTVYGADTDDFGAATVVDYSIDPSLDVTTSPYTHYYVTATDFSGNESAPATLNTASGVDGPPKSFVLSVSNYPNPFNPRTTVRYSVPSRGNVSVTIHDARGARITTVVNHEHGSAGAYSIEWDGRSDNGARVSSGVYFARIEHNGATRSKKMMLLK